MIRLKNRDEIKRIRDSGKILAELYAELEKMVEPEITTEELDRFSKHFVEQRGGRPAFLGYMDYPASLCTSVNNEIIHGIPGSRKLKEGDILSLDFGVDLKGFISDAAVTLPVGTIDKERETLIRVTKEALDLGIKAAVAGNRIKDISKSVYDHAAEHGYDVVREFCGHGVGFQVHEPPQVPNYLSHGPNPRMREGIVIAIEPMINMGKGDIVIQADNWTVVTADGSLSAHFEHTVAVFEDHTEILTKWENP